MKLQIYKTQLFLLLVGFCCSVSCVAQKPQPVASNKPSMQLGAEQLPAYLPLLKGKRVALIVNQTSIVGTHKTHLLDTLLATGVNVVKIFSPEHGFRGTADAGEKVANDKDAKTGLPIISLYGNNKKPSREALSDVDMVIFDIQDVGARFYTYISTMHYAMQACADYGKPLLVLDRPNPNGYYIAGPVLDKKFKSFVGMHPIPVVHGLTVGELAKMINGEHWLDSSKQCNLQVITVKNYTHKDKYSLPVKPSPNLPNDQSILLYPSLCLFEGTNISVARGTDFPFQAIGAPEQSLGTFSFTPRSKEGAAKNPPYENKVCYGLDLRKEQQLFSIKYVISMYQKTADKEHFFIKFFEKLAGNDALAKQIKSGMNEAEIVQTWQADLKKYKAMRKHYLLYKDFE